MKASDLTPLSDNIDRALVELVRQGRVIVTKDAEGRSVYRLVQS